MSAHVIFKWILLCFVISIGTCSFVSCGNSGNSDPVFMLKEHANINVSSIKLYGMATGAQREVSLTQAETLSYITSAFRNAENGYTPGTWTFRCIIGLRNGKKQDIKLILSESNGAPHTIALGVERGMLQDEKFYTITLPEPIPKELVQGFSTMKGQ